MAKKALSYLKTWMPGVGEGGIKTLGQMSVGRPPRGIPEPYSNFPWLKVLLLIDPTYVGTSNLSQASWQPYQRSACTQSGRVTNDVLFDDAPGCSV